MNYCKQADHIHAHTRTAFPGPACAISQPSLPAEMSEQMLARYYTLSSEDLARIRRHRRSHNKLGFAVQLAYLRFPGRTWTANEAIYLIARTMQ